MYSSQEFVLENPTSQVIIQSSEALVRIHKKIKKFGIRKVKQLLSDH